MVIIILKEIQMQENFFNIQVKLALQLKFAQITPNRIKIRLESKAYESESVSFLEGNLFITVKMTIETIR